MPERSTISQVTQIGVEALNASGTAVAANKRLQTLSIEPSPASDIDQFRPQGQKLPSVASLNKEWVEADVSGRPDYNEIIYPCASAITNPTVNQIMDGATATGAYLWVFPFSTTAESNPRSFTAEAGSPVRAARFTYGMFNELGLSVSRGGTELSGSMFGRALQDGIAMTANPTLLALVPMTTTSFDVFVDNTSTAFGTTKLGRLISAEFSLGDRYNQFYVVDSANPDWVTHIETEPSVTFNMTVEADAAGMALLSNLRSSGTRFIRLRSLGPTIYAGATPIRYSLTIDLAAKIVDTGGFSDEDGVYAIEWNWQGFHDANWGKGLHVEVVNTVPSL
jgi:CRP-like cAMP-binding protein